MKTIARLSAMVLLLWLPCASQLETRLLTGIVTDKRGNALPGAAVQLENRATLSIRSYITGKDGRYHFNGLSDNTDYTVKAKYRDYWSKQKDLSKFNGSKTPQIDLVIPIE